MACPWEIGPGTQSEATGKAHRSWSGSRGPGIRRGVPKGGWVSGIKAAT